MWASTLLETVWGLLSAPIQLLINPVGTMQSGFHGLFRRLSPASIAALLSFLFLLIMAAVSVIWRLNLPTATNDWFWPTVAWLSGLTLVIPFFVYLAVRLLLQDVSERFADIETAWASGVAELQRSGIDITERPLFLVLGCDDTLKAKYLMTASGRTLAVKNFPNDSKALRFYACNEGIYLFLSQVGSLTEIACVAAEINDKHRSKAPFQRRIQSNEIQATWWPGEDDSAVAERLSGDESAASLSELGRGTMMISDMDSGGSLNIEKATSENHRPKLSTSRGDRLSAPNLALQSRRLGFLCRLIRAARRPYCPVNGVLVQLTQPLIMADDEGGKQVMNALSLDRKMLIANLQMRPPVTVVVSGWDGDVGFHELMRRLGSKTRRQYRFGKGFSPGDPPLDDQLSAMCSVACRSFEDWIYSMFRDSEAIDRSGNRQLYALLCKVRRYLNVQLETIVSDGLGYKKEAEQDSFPLVAGCYFVAAGASEEHQAFVPKTIDRLYETAENDLEWTASALRENQRYYVLGYVILAVSICIGLATVVTRVLLSRNAFFN
jgi:hypothetical protein